MYESSLIMGACFTFLKSSADGFGGDTVKLLSDLPFFVQFFSQRLLWTDFSWDIVSTPSGIANSNITNVLATALKNSLLAATFHPTSNTSANERYAFATSFISQTTRMADDKMWKMKFFFFFFDHFNLIIKLLNTIFFSIMQWYKISINHSISTTDIRTEKKV